jgi:hypothetical protein
MPPPIMTAKYMARHRAGEQISHVFDIGIRLDDFERDLLRAIPHKRELAYPVSLGVCVAAYLRGGATRA